MTIATRLAAAREQLHAAGIAPADADLSARLLAQELLGWDAARLLTSRNQEEPAQFPAAYEQLVARRASREPLSYITGRREFWNLDFEVSPAVLIPRPETELLIEIALERFRDRGARLAIADICTGSGCVAVSLAREFPAAQVVATDLSGDAIDVARRNAARHSVAGRVPFVRTDLLDGIAERFDLIVANPPYVLETDRPALQPEVRDHEPSIALFGGSDGLGIIRRLAEQAVPRLKSSGTLLFEFGNGQAEAIDDLICRTSGLTLVGFRADLQGIPRAAIASRTA